MRLRSPYLACAAFFAVAASGGTTSPPHTTNDLDNPHKGFMLWGTDYAAGAPANYHGSTVFHVYVPWREVETADQAFAWAEFEDHHIRPITTDYPTATFVLRPVADYPDGPASGISYFYTGGENDRDYPKFIELPPLSIPYHDYVSCDGDGPGRTPDWNNTAMITQLVQFVQAFAQRYDGDPRITAVQVGLLGLWGEWHQSGCEAYQPSNGVKSAVRDAYANFFTNTPLQTRYPRDPDAVGVEFGFHEDYFPSFTAPCVYGFPLCDDTGDWNMDWCFRNVTPASTNNWMSNPISGESPTLSQKLAWTNDTDDIITVIRDYHFSFLGPAGAHEWDRGHIPLARIKRALGYNWHIESCTWPDDIYVNEPFEVTLVLTNSGSAPCYHRFPVELAICQPDGTPVWTNRWSFDLRHVTPGAARTFTESFVASGIATGVYSLRVAILHPQRGYGPGVLIQSAGRDANDRYEIGNMAVHPYDSDADGMPDAWEMRMFGNLTNAPGGDADRDGSPNADEYVAGTIPSAATSVFQCLEISQGYFPTLGNVVAWSSVSGRVYGIESCTGSLSVWSSITSGLPAYPPRNSWTNPDPASAGPTLFRLNASRE